MQRIKHCINPSLVSICKRAIELESLTDVVQQYLPLNHRNHCAVSSFNSGCLVLQVDTAALASELRYMLPDLRDKLRSDAKLYQLSHIKVRVC